VLGNLQFTKGLAAIHKRIGVVGSSDIPGRSVYGFISLIYLFEGVIPIGVTRIIEGHESNESDVDQ
jgi:hypothetical protein